MVGDHHITQDLEDMVAGVYNLSYLLVGFWQTQLFFFFMFWLASDMCLVNLFRMCSLWVLLWCRSGHGSVRNMTGEALIPSSALSFVIGNPSLPNRTDLLGMCSSQDGFPPLFCGLWIYFSSVQDVLIFEQDNYTAYPAALFLLLKLVWIAVIRSRSQDPCETKAWCKRECYWDCWFSEAQSYSSQSRQWIIRNRSSRWVLSEILVLQVVYAVCLDSSHGFGVVFAVVFLDRL